MSANAVEDAGNRSRPGQVRASDAEREEYATVIREAVGEGRLTLGEGDERLAEIYAVRHRDELPPLIADLPRGAATDPRSDPGSDPRSAGYLGPWRGPRRHHHHHGWPAGPGALSGAGPGAGSGAVAPPWGPPGWGSPAMRGRAFARHLGFVLTVSAILVGLWAITSSAFFWPAIPLTFFAISLLRHAFGLGWSRRRWSR